MPDQCVDEETWGAVDLDTLDGLALTSIFDMHLRLE